MMITTCLILWMPRRPSPGRPPGGQAISATANGPAPAAPARGRFMRAVPPLRLRGHGRCALRARTAKLLAALLRSIRVSKPRSARVRRRAELCAGAREDLPARDGAWRRSSWRRPRRGPARCGARRRPGGSSASRSKGSGTRGSSRRRWAAGRRTRACRVGENSEKNGVEPNPTNMLPPASCCALPSLCASVLLPGRRSLLFTAAVAVPQVELEHQRARGRRLERRAGLVVEQADLVRLPPSARRAGSRTGRRDAGGSCSPCRPGSTGSGRWCGRSGTRPRCPGRRQDAVARQQLDRVEVVRVVVGAVGRRGVGVRQRDVTERVPLPDHQAGADVDLLDDRVEQRREGAGGRAGEVDEDGRVAWSGARRQMG